MGAEMITAGTMVVIMSAPWNGLLFSAAMAGVLLSTLSEQDACQIQEARRWAGLLIDRIERWGYSTLNAIETFRSKKLGSTAIT